MSKHPTQTAAITMTREQAERISTALLNARQLVVSAANEFSRRRSVSDSQKKLTVERYSADNKALVEMQEAIGTAFNPGGY